MKSTSRVPSDLAPRSRALWTKLHARPDVEFSPDADEFCERGLRSMDLADELTAKAREVGFDTPKGRGLLASARDLNMAALKFFAACGLDKLDEVTPRRPGRPADVGWSAMRGGKKVTAL